MPKFTYTGKAEKHSVTVPPSKAGENPTTRFLAPGERQLRKANRETEEQPSSVHHAPRLEETRKGSAAATTQRAAA